MENNDVVKRWADDEVIKRWIDAGITIGKNIDAQVLCPVCQKTFLRVFDVEFENNSVKFERCMVCDECGAYNALLMTKKDE